MSGSLLDEQKCSESDRPDETNKKQLWWQKFVHNVIYINQYKGSDRLVPDRPKQYNSLINTFPIEQPYALVRPPS